MKIQCLFKRLYSKSDATSQSPGILLSNSCYRFPRCVRRNVSLPYRVRRTLSFSRRARRTVSLPCRVRRTVSLVRRPHVFPMPQPRPAHRPLEGSLGPHGRAVMAGLRSPFRGHQRAIASRSPRCRRYALLRSPGLTPAPTAAGRLTPAKAGCGNRDMAKWPVKTASDTAIRCKQKSHKITHCKQKSHRITHCKEKSHRITHCKEKSHELTRVINPSPSICSSSFAS